MSELAYRARSPSWVRRSTLASQRRFTSLNIDCIGPLPYSEGYCHLLLVADRTSRWWEAILIKSAGAADCTRALVRQWVCRYGLPATVCSDNGSGFIAAIWKEMQKYLGIRGTFGPAWHQPTNGKAEREIRTLKEGLTAHHEAMGQQHGEAWMEHLPWIILRRHTAYQPEIDASPAELVFGQTILVPGDMEAFHAGTDLPSSPEIKHMLQSLQTLAAKPPVTTSRHGKVDPPAPYFPEAAKTATHVFIRRSNFGRWHMAPSQSSVTLATPGWSCGSEISQTAVPDSRKSTGADARSPTSNLISHMQSGSRWAGS